MMFSLAKGRMEKSKLWKIVRRMPKGALLHCHLEAMVDLDWLFDEALRTEGLCVQAKQSLHTEDGLSKGLFRFAISSSASPGSKSIWSEEYEPDSLVLLTESADTFPQGGRDGFMRWLKSRFTITHDESIKHHEGINEVWRKFTSIFAILGSLLFHETLCRKMLRHIFHQLREDGVQYVEFRHGFVAPFKPQGADDYAADSTNFLTVFKEELAAFQDTDEGRDFWGARLIWSGIRRFDIKTIVKCMLQVALPRVTVR